MLNAWLELIGILTIALVITVGLTFITKPTLRHFLLADGKVPLAIGAVSVSACWLQHYALLVSATFAATSAYGYLSYLIMGTLSMILAGLVAPRIQALNPNGFTTPEFVGAALGSPRMRTLLLFAALFSSLFVIYSTMISSQLWFSEQLGLNPASVSIVIGAYALGLIFVTGLPGAIIGDLFKMIMVFALIVIGGFLSYVFVGADTAHLPGLFAETGKGEDWWTLGVAIGATALGGGLLNCDQGERMRAIRKEHVRTSYFIAAGVYALVVIILGGFLGTLPKFIGIDPGRGHVLLAVLKEGIRAGAIPSWILFQVAIMIPLILVASLSSMAMGTGDLVAIEVFQRYWRNRHGKDLPRWVMIAASRAVICTLLVSTVAVGTMGFTNKELFYLQFFMGPIRGAAILPILIAASAYLMWRIPEPCVFWGMVSGWVGAAVLTYGNDIWVKLFGQESVPFLANNGVPLGVLWAVCSILVFFGIERIVFVIRVQSKFFVSRLGN